MAHRFRSVLVASDLGEGSDLAVASAARLAAAGGAELHVVHSLDILALEYPGERSLQEDIAHAERELEAQVERTVPAGVAVRSQAVLLSLAHASILERAAAVGAELIVLGSHRGGQRGIYLGTTADHVVSRATVPCLVMNGPLALPLQRVVAAYDFSGPSEVALAEALAWSAAFGPVDPDSRPPELVAVHVLRPPEPLGEYFADMDHVGELLEERVQASGELQSDSWGVPARVSARGHVLWSEPADDAITGYGADADLLVLGTRGKGALRRIILGSVASSVARRAACPVLLVPAAARHRQASIESASSLPAAPPRSRPELATGSQ